MDIVTHTLAGWTLARAGAGRLGPYSTPVLLVAANVPDIGFLHLVAGSAGFLKYGAWTHSIIGAGALGAGVGWAFWRWRQRRLPELSRRNLLLAGALGALAHLLLDWSTSAGAELLWPLHRKYYALDWFSLVDLWMLSFLLLGVALPALFSLISEEIGARHSRAGVRRGAWLALIACVLLAGGRAALHERAITLVDSRLYKDRTPLRSAAFPTPLNPFHWRGVVETLGTFESGELTLAGPQAGQERFTTHFKPQPSPLLDAALATASARAFLGWARFPLVEVIPASDGYRVEMQDLRDAGQRPSAPTFVAQILLNRQSEVEEESLRLVWSDD